MRALSILLIAALPHSATAAKASLPAPLEDFLGAPPAKFETRFLRPAKDLKAAHDLAKAHNVEGAIHKLNTLLNGEMGEHATFELATLYRDKKNFAKSSAQAQRVIRGYPNSVYFDRAKDMLDANECDQGLTAKNEEGTRMLERCLWRAPWKGWAELEPQASALYERLKGNKDPLFEPFVTEVIQAMPAGNPLRQRIAREIPGEKLDKLASLARFRTKAPTPAGVKATYPDVELFDSGMKAVLKEEWKDANTIFKRFPAEFPQSEHWDRAQYWIARTEAKLGHDDEAKKRFEQILAENPLTYYGLQAAIYLKKDWLPQISDVVASPTAKWEGALTSRQALSLWRLRALMSVGLLDAAREEAKTLGASKVNGAGIGQEDPKGALLLASLFGQSGNYIAAFSHAYAALSLDPTLLNRGSVSLIFPRPFADEFHEAAARTGVNELLLVSVAKQESAFLPNAISRADALGLMQLLPVTARDTMPGITRGDLFEPGPNAKVGGLYLYKLLDRYQGNIAQALAAYNAGPNRVAQWMKEIGEEPAMKTFDPDVFIDTIPFSETRKYVGNILRNYAWYKMLAKDGPVTSVQELMFQWQKSVNKTPVPATPTPKP